MNDGIECLVPAGTFMGIPSARSIRPGQAGIVGIPFDCGVHPTRIGSRQGPAAIRQQSGLVRPYYPPLSDTNVLVDLNAVDLGDVAVTCSDVQSSFAAIEKAMDAVLFSGGYPVTMDRIDKDTSGVVVFARTAEAHRMLNVAFEQREVRKAYVAFVAGGLDGVSRIDVPLHEARKGKARPAEPDEPGARHAVTELVVVRRWLRDGAIVSKVRCHPITGRHHQLRVHLRWAGAPILHDPLYGKDTLRGPLAAAPCPRLALHAAELTVPGGRRFVAPLPDDLVALERWLDG
jgi:hypothetical protein